MHMICINKKEKKNTYRRGGIVGEPDGGELAPAKLPLSDVATAVKVIADPDGVIASFPIGIDALIVLLRRR